MAHHLVVGAIDHGLGIAEELHLLHAFLFNGTEVLLVGGPDVGEHTNGGLDDVVQGFHLTRLTDAGLEDAHTTLLTQQPHRQGHTNLRVVAARRTGDSWRGSLVGILAENLV